MVTTHPFLIRRFSGKRPQIRKRIKWSTYLPPPIMQVLLDDKRIVDDDYIICPIYLDGAIQMGITGTVGSCNESYAKAATRELGEEVGLVPSFEGCLHLVRRQQFQGESGPKRMAVYIGNLKDFHPVPFTRHQEQGTQGQDNITKKVGCLIISDRAEAKKYLSRKNIHILHSEDEIVGIAAVKVADARVYALTTN